MLEKFLRTGQVRVDGRRAKAGQRLEAGQQVRVPPITAAQGEEKSSPVRPIDPLRAQELVDAILYMDDDVIVLNKPPGLAVQGGTHMDVHLDGMLDALTLGAAERPRLVHRLDKRYQRCAAAGTDRAVYGQTRCRLPLTRSA